MNSENIERVTILIVDDVPANRKWYRDLVIMETIVETLEGLNMKYPEPTIAVSKIKIDD